MDVPLWAWLALGAIIVVMLAIDLLAHRGAHVIGFREAAKWSALWVGLAIAFGIVVFATLGTQAGVDYTTAWLLEKSLSVDNLFVFALIFGYFNVPREFQHRVLFFGVLGALVFRGIFLGAGVAIVERFTAVLFVFGAILIWSAFKMLKGDDESVDPGKSLAVRLLRRVIPMKDEYHGTKFFIKEAGKRFGTPLLAVVVAIEAADLVFAVDSVPAVLAVTSDPFIVYSSNAFAILGLRALYFLLSGMLERFHLLSKALAFILAFIGVKLFLQAGHEIISESIPHIPSWMSLIVIVVALTWAIVFSLRKPAPVTGGSDDEQVTAGPADGPDAPTGTGSTATASTGTGSATDDASDPTDGRPTVSSSPDGSR
ncbi:TerC/Alx family metal homeostasis membrane protein [Kineococcus sp. R8]|uniref:TerC/Alx family metal homeostasis membrane protein n=1 Tax=Kineococcus siccus TaxID=2696567 RepID=UPI0014122E0F|nr:TerC/Alx family metal homeostasis membrane protein [Kineococcus siccus]